jgi:hypothetical protein
VGKSVRRDGLLVTALCPGGIDTPLWNVDNPYPFDRNAMIRPEEAADLIDYILRQPKRRLFENVVFVPTVEQWRAPPPQPAVVLRPRADGLLASNHERW